MNTRDQILALAEGFVKHRGFRGFSYKDIAERLNIKPAAIHYHFPKKDDLGEALAKRYLVTLSSALESASDASPPEQIALFIQLYRETLGHGDLCLCASVASDAGCIPKAMNQHAQSFFTKAERWLYQVFQRGEQTGDFTLKRDPISLGREFLAITYGAMLLAHNSGDLSDFEETLLHWQEGNLGKTS